MDKNVIANRTMLGLFIVIKITIMGSILKCCLSSTEKDHHFAIKVEYSDTDS